MLSAKDLRELVEFAAPESVLSVYLNTEPSAGNADAYRLRLRTMLKEARLPAEAAASAAAVERYFQQDYDRQGNSVAIFSCAARNFFRAFSLAIPIRDMVRLAERPIIQPLTNLIDIYGGYGVVLVDQQGARLFYIHLGELLEQEGTFGEAVKRTKRGGSSTLTGRRGGTAGMTRAAEQTVEKNMKDSAVFAVHFFEKKRIRRILIGGTEDNIAMFRGELPKAWQSLVMGTFSMEIGASHKEVAMKAMQIGQQIEKQHEAHLVKELIDAAAAKSGMAVVGLSSTLNALNNGRVQTLLVAEEFHQPGYHCASDDKLGLDATCPECTGEMAQAPDIVELAVNSVLRHKGQVEIVHANDDMVNSGSIGAMLRY